MSKNLEYLRTLKNLVGEDLYKAVKETFAGQRIIFPKNTDLFGKEKRDKQIIEGFRSGTTIPELAEKYELSKSQIYKIINEY